MKRTVNFVIDSHIWLAFNALLFVSLTYRLMGVSSQWQTMAFLFFATLAVYTLQQKPSVSFFFQKREMDEASSGQDIFQVFLFWGSITIIVWLMFHFRIDKIYYLLHLAAISLLYAFPSSRHFLMLPLRSLPFTKIFLLLYVWISATVIFPLWDRVSDGHFFFLLTAERSFFIFAIGLSFDIRDNSDDLNNRLKTIANQAGIFRTKVMALMSLSSAALLAFLLYESRTATAILLSYLITSLLIIKAGEEKENYYFTGLIDGSMALQWVLVMLGDWMLGR